MWFYSAQHTEILINLVLIFSCDHNFMAIAYLQRRLIFSVGYKQGGICQGDGSGRRVLVTGIWDPPLELDLASLGTPLTGSNENKNNNPICQLARIPGFQRQAYVFVGDFAVADCFVSSFLT